MLKKIKRQDCLASYPFPTSNYNQETDELEYFYPPVYKSYVYSLPGTTFKGNIAGIGLELTKLIKELGSGSLIFMGENERPWLYQKNDFRSAQLAEQYLIDNKIGKRFNGAIEVPVAAIRVFIKHFCWLVRCNASLSYFHFMDAEQKIIANICQYGDLHICAISKEADDLLNSFFKNSKFIVDMPERCTWRFSKSRGIPGRRIVI